MTNANEKKHVAIIGAGLVGSLLSIYMAKRGYRVSVFERRGDLRAAGAEAGRSINLALSTRGIRALTEAGMAGILKDTAIPMHGRVMHDPKGNLSFLAYGKEGEYINSVSRGGLNGALITAAESYGVHFYFGQRCSSIDFAKTEITLQDDNGVAMRHFDQIIGADGVFSAVRGAMQITDRFDYEQDYIDHGYKELHIPPRADGEYALEKNALHIWPRESFMMIALPNPDASFTCTLFLPFEGEPSFSQLTSEGDVRSFFEKYFGDVVPLMPDYLGDFNRNPTSSLLTIKCFPWVRHRTLLIGDAAHGIVPFYGQGMNAGFEDCRILNALLDDHDDQWDVVLPAFQSLRKPDADAIARLALDNFIEMRDLVADPEFLLRKKIEAHLQKLYPGKWIPLYGMVTFQDDVRYSEALKTGMRQKRIMDEVMKRPGLAANWESLDFQSIIEQTSRHE